MWSSLIKIFHHIVQEESLDQKAAAIVVDVPNRNGNLDEKKSSYPVQKVVSICDWIQAHVTQKFKRRSLQYVKSLFPIATWIYRYNTTWLVGDLIAGLTVGSVVVPQSMSYAKIANLPAQYGLYSSFVGVLVYCFFATSKDVTIGPVAVMSLEVSRVIHKVHASSGGEQYTGPQIATMLALMCGGIVLAIGLLRIGWLVEFIPAPAVAGFMTGSAISIAAGQIPALLGISKRLNTRDPVYLVIINTLKNLPYCDLNAAFGLVTLSTLYIIRWFFNFCSKRWPSYRRGFFFGLVLRSGVVIIFCTLFSWLVCRNFEPGSYPISIIETVPRGFQNIGPPVVNAKLASLIAPSLPVATIILLLEHIAISKSFGRINNYKIMPDQELIAIGMTNLIGVFFNAYPATGSFSRSAIKSKSGVRTPLAGIFTGILVILALYALTGTFYWIPNAGLAAIIVHAVGDLIAPPSQVYKFWQIAPLECIIFFAGVFVTIFTTIENGIYTTIGASLGLLLLRVALPDGQFLGILKVQTIGTGKPVKRFIFVPLSRRDTNPAIQVEDPPPGVLIYRLEESFTYPNASRINDKLVDEAKRKTRPGNFNRNMSLGSRPWNEPGPRHYDKLKMEVNNRPLLEAIILDFSSVGHLDTTGVQHLVDTQKQLEKYAGQHVAFHFANILSPWVTRALIAAGFGMRKHGLKIKHIVEVASAFPRPDALDYASVRKEEESNKRFETDFATRSSQEEDLESCKSLVPVVGMGAPYFHVDLNDAFRAVTGITLNEWEKTDKNVIERNSEGDRS